MVILSSCQPSLPLPWKKRLFCRVRSWRKDDLHERWQPAESGNRPRWPWRGRPIVGPVSASCATGKLTKTFWQKGHELTVQLGRFPALFALTLASLALQAQFHNSKKWPCIFTWLNCSSSTLFFKLLPIPFPPLHSLPVCLLQCTIKKSWVPGCLLPSSFFILHPLMFVILDGLCDGAASLYTV